MPPSYGTKAYWDARFQHEDKYEWLLPADSLNAVIREALSEPQKKSRSPGDSSRAPQILHIGCGSSDLSFQLRDLVAAPNQITNVDYSSMAVQKCRQRESEALFATTADAVSFATLNGSDSMSMRWETADLLAAESIARLGGNFPSHSAVSHDFGGCDDDPLFFDVVADKSTSDSISCAADAPVLLPFVSPRMVQQEHPQQQQTGNDAAANTTKAATAFVHPMYLLAVHMAVLTRPRTGRWCVLSYSDERFSFLDGGGKKGIGAAKAEEPVEEDLLQRGFPDPRRFWRVERRERVTVAPPAAATGSGGHVVHQPEIAYWLYVLVRTNEVP
ncbi:hypothetical protein PG995_001862 [Apiospora arundinis]